MGGNKMEFQKEELDFLNQIHLERYELEFIEWINLMEAEEKATTAFQ